MNRCNHPDHPHCTVWVMPGDSACAHGHPQPSATEPVAVPPAGPPPASASLRQHPHLHISGFDPRAAGGRQVLKLELRGMPLDAAATVTLLASSRLQLENGERHSFTRTVRGDWLPVFLEFSSRGLEHGQYRIEIELHSRSQSINAAARTWIATLLILAPRADASLHDIHQTFLATHKNVRVHADDASIARLKARTGGGALDIDLRATNAGIAHLDLDNEGGGKIDLGFSSIAWDEDLLEIDVPAQAAQHPCPASAACLVQEDSGRGTPQLPPQLPPQWPRFLRLFALDECVIGRSEPGAPGADIRLMHHGESGLVPEGLTRRISGRHALLRRGRDGFEIEDVSRYGLLVDGAWPGRHAPAPLRPGMRIELTASIPGVAVLEVTAVLPNGILLHRLDAGMEHEAFYVMDPERTLDASPRLAALGLPLLFHRDGGFWHLDPLSGVETPLTPTVATAGLPGWPQGARFAARPYPERRSGPATLAPRQERATHERRAAGA